MTLKVTDIDHIVLRVQDVERAIEFYTGVLGMVPYRVDECRAGKVPPFPVLGSTAPRSLTFSRGLKKSLWGTAGATSITTALS